MIAYVAGAVAVIVGGVTLGTILGWYAHEILSPELEGLSALTEEEEWGPNELEEWDD